MALENFTSALQLKIDLLVLIEFQDGVLEPAVQVTVEEVDRGARLVAVCIADEAYGRTVEVFRIRGGNDDRRDLSGIQAHHAADRV